MRIVGYEFKEGARFQPGAKPEAEAVGNHLEMLRKHFKGELTPQDVVDDARKNNSPLHGLFEWNDGLAAEQYRLAQARSLIRSVVAIYKDDEPERPVVRAHAFTHIPEGETSHYRDTAHALSQKDTRDAVLQRAWRELAAWRLRYKSLKEFAGFIETVERMEKELPRRITKVN